MMNRSLKELILLQFRTFFREPAILFWAVAFPILMSWVLGVAFTQKGEVVRTVYVISSNPPATISGEKLYGQETKNPLKVKYKNVTEEAALKALRKGEIVMYIEPRQDSLIYHFDPTNPDAQLTHLLIEKGIHGSKDDFSAVVPLTRVGTRYIDFLIPGLIAFGIMNSCLWGIGWNLIEFRMKKLLRRMVATPMKKSYFFIAQILTRIVLSSFESVILLLFAFLYFDIQITGSVFALLLVFVSGVFAFSGIGIITAAKTANSQVGNGLINAVTIPMTILSGVFFNYHNFPEWAIPFIQILPLTMLADAIRAVFIEAAEVKDVLFQITTMCLIGLVTFVSGMKIFKWY